MTNLSGNADHSYARIRGTKKDDQIKGQNDHGTLKINAGAGDDDIDVTGIGGKNVIFTGIGDDKTTIDNDYALNKLFNGGGDDINHILTDFCENKINNGNGDDKNILLGNHNDTTINNGRGDDKNKVGGYANDTKINNGRGDDVNVISGSYNDTDINMGRGDDVTIVKGDGYGNTTRIDGGRGQDEVRLEGNWQMTDVTKEDGKTYRVYTDDRGNTTKVAMDVEKVTINRPEPQPMPFPGFPTPTPMPVPPGVITPPPVQGPAPTPIEPPAIQWPKFEPPAGGGVEGWLGALGSWFSAVLSAIMNPAPPPVVAANEVGTITGDPHFKGGDGGKYDVQGEPGKSYSLLSDSNLQFNGRFDAWGGGGATVVGETGLTVQGPYGQSSVTFQKDGTAAVNGMELKDGQTVQLADGGTATKEGNKLTIKTAEGYEITQTVHGSSHGNYINTEVKTGAGGVAQDGVLPGGLLGQTFDPDSAARNGKKGAGAQGEGAISGTVGQYEVGSLVPQPPPVPYGPVPYMPQIDGQYIAGNDDAERIAGTNKNDMIIGQGGDDKLIGKKGDDAIHGGAGNDKIYGNQGNDVLIGGAGDDKLYGQQGNDTIYAGQGSDIVRGGVGDDRVIVNSANQHGTVQDIKAGKGQDVVQIKAENGTNNTYKVDLGKGDDTVALETNGPVKLIKRPGFFSRMFGASNYIVEDAAGNRYELKDFNPKQDKLVINGQQIDPRQYT